MKFNLIYFIISELVLGCTQLFFFVIDATVFYDTFISFCLLTFSRRPLNPVVGLIILTALSISSELLQGKRTCVRLFSLGVYQHCTYE